jgi:hypothetical protein
VLLYAVVCGIVGLGLGYLLWITFGPKEEPFREDAKLAVGEVRLVDLRQYHGLLKSATCRLTVPRIAESSYDADMAILRVEGKALGNAEAAFADAEGRPLGSVGVHVLAGARRKYVDRMALTKEQRKVQAQDLLREGEALAKAHIAEALLKYEMANHLLELEGTEDPALVALAKMRLDDLTAERESRFRKLKDRYRQANKLRDFAVQKDSLDEICKLFPDPSDEENQRAKIFLKRVLASERAQQKKKE